MERVNRNYVVLGMGLLGLAACTQQPAPVVGGYESQGVRLTDYSPATKPYTLRAMRDEEAAQAAAQVVSPARMAAQEPVPMVEEEDLSRIEPAAGGVAPVRRGAEQPQQARPVFAPVEVTGDGTYTMLPQDTLYKVARAHDTTARELMEMNGLTSTVQARPGMVLKVPLAGGNEVAAPVMAESATVNAVSRAEAALARLEGKRPPEAPRLTAPAVADAPSDEVQEQMAAKAAALEPAAGAAPRTPLSGKTTAEDVSYVDHRVTAGETLYRISLRYKASVIDIMAANDLQTPQDLKAGSVVRVPISRDEGVSEQVMAGVADTPEKVVREVPVQAAETASARDAAQIAAQAAAAAEEKAKEAEEVLLMQKGRIDPTAAKAKGLAWPVKGKILRKYGEEGQGVTHTGINIAVPENTPVLSSDAGKVIYAGNGLKTYGNLVLVRHNDGMVTAYGHNSRLLVSKGEAVKKGQVIALSGASGNVSEPQLHFEIRKQAKAIDPLRVLASR